jgi:hypothetical protein
MKLIKSLGYICHLYLMRVFTIFLLTRLIYLEQSNTHKHSETLLSNLERQLAN